MVDSHIKRMQHIQIVSINLLFIFEKGLATKTGLTTNHPPASVLLSVELQVHQSRS